MVTAAPGAIAQLFGHGFQRAINLALLTRNPLGRLLRGGPAFFHDDRQGGIGELRVEVLDEPGDLRFSYPPEKAISNVVGTVKIKSLRWRQYLATDAWISATFEASRAVWNMLSPKNAPPSAIP